MLEKLAAKLAGRHPQKSSEEMTNPAFAELIAYVNEHSAEKLSLEQLGKKFSSTLRHIVTSGLQIHASLIPVLFSTMVPHRFAI